MPALMVFNPRRKRKGARRGARKMTAKQLRYFGSRRQREAVGGSRRRSSARKGRGPREVVIMSANPRRKATMSKVRRRNKVRRFRNNPRRSFRRRTFRRNPIGFSAGDFISNTLVPGVMGALGAVGVDLAIGNLPLPASMKQGTMLPIVRIGGALLIGGIAGMVINPKVGEEVAAGGVIVTLYSLIKNFMTKNMPNVTMARYVPMHGMGRGVRGMGNIRRRRRLGFIRRRNAALGVMPRSQRKMVRLRGIRRPMHRGARFANRGMAGLGLNMGYMGPAPTLTPMGRYI
jgi:hypothetical protein